MTGSGDADPATGTQAGRRCHLAHLRRHHGPAVLCGRHWLGYRHVLLVEPASGNDFAVVAGHELWLIDEQLRERVTVHVPWTTRTGRP